MRSARHSYPIDGFVDYDDSTIHYLVQVAQFLENSVTQQAEEHNDDICDVRFFLWRQLTASLLTDGLAYKKLQSNLRLVNDEILLAEAE